MAEYIVEYPAWADEYIDVHDCINVHERIVRCKDCKFYDTEGVYTDYTRELQENNCYHFKDYEGSPMPVGPDGFCAWGELREG